MPRHPRGFTLIELLVVITIMGLLTTVGTVSYESARASARDAKRVSDVKAIQGALEWYFEDHQGYPLDDVPGPEGSILGAPETAYLSEAGFGPQAVGRLYLIVPKNAEPNGSPYVYRALDLGGQNCDSGSCGSFAVIFTLEKPSGSLLAGTHALTPQGVIGAEGGIGSAGVAVGGEIIGTEGRQAFITRSANQVVDSVQDVIDDPGVERVAEAAVAPVATGLAAGSAIAALPSGLISLQYLLSFLAQPFLLLSRRSRKRWGVVYNSLSKLPEDLVIVRLRDAAAHVVKSAVTDAYGSFSFLVRRGSYRVEAVKVGFRYPSDVSGKLREDAQYTDVYHGEFIEVGENGALLTPNIPIDPAGIELTDAEAVSRSQRREFHRFAAGLGPVFGGLAFTVRPTLTVGLLFAAQIFMYLFFRRLAVTPEPRSWGIVYDEESRRPINQAVVRIFALPYHKLLETQVTDSRGRYHFRVGANVYYLTISKAGFLKTETDPIDLRDKTEPTVIASDLPVRRPGAPDGNPAKDISEVLPTMPPEDKPAAVAAPASVEPAKPQPIQPTSVVPPPSPAPIGPAPIAPVPQPTSMAAPATEVPPEVAAPIGRPAPAAGAGKTATPPPMGDVR